MRFWLGFLASFSFASFATAYTVSTLPSGALLSPLASPASSFNQLNPHLTSYPNYTAGQAVNMALSPDGKTLLILTSGFNLLADAAGKKIPGASNEYVFVEDISGGNPVKRQALQISNTYIGITFAPDGQHFYVSGGVDDSVHVFSLADGHWTESAAPIVLGHLKGINPKDKIYAGGNGLGVPPQAAGLAISQDGKTIAVADFENDSRSLVDLTSQQVTDVPLRPGIINPKLGDAVGGEYPFEVTIKGNDTAYVTSLRDREVDVVTLRGTPRVIARTNCTATRTACALMPAPRRSLSPAITATMLR